MTHAQIIRAAIFPLRIPFRKPFAHGSAVRSASDNVVLELELETGHRGYGETLARDYVTGETAESVVKVLQDLYCPLLSRFRPAAFGEVLAVLEELPTEQSGQPLLAARCAVELALLDAYGQLFDRDPGMLAGWIDQPTWEPPGAIPATRYSGVIGFAPPEKALARARLMRWWGLSDLKIKVGDAEEFDRLEAVVDGLRRPIQRGALRLRVDANGSWSPQELPAKIDRLQRLGITYLEQPTPRLLDESWTSVQYESDVDLIADESLITMRDAERLVSSLACGVFNIRLAKNGGLLPALRLAALALNYGVEVQLGCLVGETAILDRAGQWFAALVPRLIFAEGGYGPILLADDVVARPRRLPPWRGRIPRPAGPGLGLRVDRQKLRTYAAGEPTFLAF